MTDFINTLRVYPEVSDAERDAANKDYLNSLPPSKAKTPAQRRRATLVRNTAKVVLATVLLTGAFKFAMSDTGMEFFKNTSQTISQSFNPSEEANISALPASMPGVLKAAINGESDMEYEEFHALFQNYVSSLINGDSTQAQEYYELAEALGAGVSVGDRTIGEIGYSGGVHELFRVMGNAQDLALAEETDDQTRFLASELLLTTSQDVGIVGVTLDEFEPGATIDPIGTLPGQPTHYTEGSIEFADDENLNSKTVHASVAHNAQLLYDSLYKTEVKVR